MIVAQVTNRLEILGQVDKFGAKRTFLWCPAGHLGVLGPFKLKSGALCALSLWPDTDLAIDIFPHVILGIVAVQGLEMPSSVAGTCMRRLL
jgi:hypothetical protein